MPKPKNILIFVSIAAVFVAVYIYFLKPDAAEDANLVSSPTSPVSTAGMPPAGTAAVQGPSLAAGDFLTLLLNVKNIKLEDAIFSDPAFQSLSDSSIVLEPDGNEGRPNPFAPLGQDIAPLPISVPDAGSPPEGETESPNSGEGGQDTSAESETNPEAGTI